MFIPDLAILIAVVTLFYCLFLFGGTQKLFRDSDTGWHIRTGESIIATMSLPRHDPYSFSRAGQPWFAWEWGADVLMGAAHRAAGLGGVALLFACAVAACTWMWFRLTWTAGGDFFLACLLASPMLSTANLHWLARPHVFGWLFALGAVWFSESLSRPGGRPPGWKTLAGIAAVSALWANIHASFLMGPLIGLIYALGHLVRQSVWDDRTGHRFSWPVEDRAEGPGTTERAKNLTDHDAEDAATAAARPKNLTDHTKRWSVLLWFALAAAVSLAATLLNPYGWNLHRHVVRYLTDRELLQRIGEFQSFNFHAAGSGQILLALGVAALGCTLSLGQKRAGGCLVAALLIGGALRSARGLPLVALLALPLANGAIARGLKAAVGLNPRLRPVLDGALAYSSRVRALDAGLRGWLWAPLAVLLAFAILKSPAVAVGTGFPPDQFPVAAAAAVAGLPPEARLLAPDKFGGYLIYRFEGRRRVFFDGRSDFYGAQFMKDYIRLVEVRPGWQEQVRKWSFTHALLPADYSLAAALEAAGWKVVYRDPTAVLLERI